MPIVPRNSSSDAGAAQIPGVMSPDSHAASALGALGGGISDLGRGMAGAAMIIDRTRKREAYDESQKALTQYTSDLSGLWGGTVDPSTGEQTQGLKHLDAADTDGAAKKLAAWQRDWRDRKDGVYAKLSPEARARFDAEAQAVYTRFGNMAVEKDFDSRQIMRERTRDAFIVSQTGMAAQFHFDGERFAEAEASAASAIAAAKVGPGLLNPEERDPSKMKFASETFRQQYDAERLAASEALRFDRAKTMVSAARTIDDDGLAGERLGVAREIAKGLNPKLQSATLELAAEAEGHRKAVKNAETIERRRVAAERATALEASVDAVRYRFFRGEIDARAAFDETDKLFAAGLGGDKATELREFVTKQEESKAKAAEMDKNTFAASGRGDTSEYLALQDDVLRGAEPWRTEERLLAAAKSGAIEEGQFKTLFEANRNGMDQRTQKAVRAALSAAAELDSVTVDSAFSKDSTTGSTTKEGKKALAKLMSGLSYDYDRPMRVDFAGFGGVVGSMQSISRAGGKITAAEFDGLVESTRLFIEANPDKDPYKDFLQPMIEPKVAAARAVDMAKRLSLENQGGMARSALEREEMFNRTLGQMPDRTMAERLAVGRATINAGKDDSAKAKSIRVGRMAAEYEAGKGAAK